MPFPSKSQPRNSFGPSVYSLSSFTEDSLNVTKEDIAYAECLGEVLKVPSRKHLLTVPAAKNQFPLLTIVT